MKPDFRYGGYCQCCGEPEESLYVDIEQGFDTRHTIRTYNNEVYIEPKSLTVSNCSNCGEYIGDENFKTSTQRHPYGDTYATEVLCEGYHCTSCGHDENY